MQISKPQKKQTQGQMFRSSCNTHLQQQGTAEAVDSRISVLATDRKLPNMVAAATTITQHTCGWQAGYQRPLLLPKNKQALPHASRRATWLLLQDVRFLLQRPTKVHQRGDCCVRSRNSSFKIQFSPLTSSVQEATLEAIQSSMVFAIQSLRQMLV